MDVLTLDGLYGEGSGQILRTALSLSAVTGRPFRLFSICAGRHNPGLLPQHLSAVRAAMSISLRNVPRSIGLVSSASAPLSSALRLVSASP
jgi:RNA 3'-terminal phosphate cyclase